VIGYGKRGLAEAVFVARAEHDESGTLIVDEHNHTSMPGFVRRRRRRARPRSNRGPDGPCGCRSHGLHNRCELPI
jgi:hypothetical protein